jgi:S1-C subfamily serine protease
MNLLNKLFLGLCVLGVLGLCVGGPAVVLLTEKQVEVQPVEELKNELLLEALSSATDVVTVERAMDAVVHVRAFVDKPSYEEEYYAMAWQGSGCFITTDGTIMTARHVVEGADYFEITLRDGRTFVTDVSLAANNLDVGFIKIEVEGVPCLCFSESDPLLGEDVWLYGHPLGDRNGWSVTKGIVSNVERDCEGFFGEFMMIQSDAASWPGNSGGPVINQNGQIVGVLVGGIVGQECLSYISPGDMCKEWSDVMKEWLECQKNCTRS